MSEQYDEIVIRDLLVRAILGINPSERINKQDILINVTIYVPQIKSLADDHIDQTTNYRSICKKIIEHVESSSYQLVETLVLSLFDIIFKNFDIPKLTIQLEKPHALRFAESVGIKMTRYRNDSYGK